PALLSLPPSSTFCFSHYSSPAHPHLPSFPTRRSSDLLANRGQILEQLTLQRAPHLGALLGGPARRYHAGPLLPRQRLRPRDQLLDRKSTRLNSSHRTISYAVFCLKKKKKNRNTKSLQI